MDKTEAATQLSDAVGSLIAAWHTCKDKAEVPPEVRTRLDIVAGTYRQWQAVLLVEQGGGYMP